MLIKQGLQQPVVLAYTSSTLYLTVWVQWVQRDKRTPCSDKYCCVNGRPRHTSHEPTVAGATMRPAGCLSRLSIRLFIQKITRNHFTPMVRNLQVAMGSVLSVSLSSLFRITLSAGQFNLRTRKMVQTLLPFRQEVGEKRRLLNTFGSMVESKALEAVAMQVYAGNEAWTFSAPLQLLDRHVCRATCPLLKR